MSQIMHPNFKSVGRQAITEILWSGILAFRNEVEGGSKAEVTLQFHQLAAALQPFVSLDVVGQHHSKLLPSRPSRPPFWRLSRTRADGPGVCELPLASLRLPSPQSDSQRPGHKRLDEIVGMPLPPHSQRSRL